MSEKIKILLIILLASFFLWDFYKKTEEIKYLQETISIQHEAILSQNLLIYYYKSRDLSPIFNTQDPI